MNVGLSSSAKVKRHGITHIHTVKLSCFPEQGGHRHSPLEGLSLAHPSAKNTPGNREDRADLPGQNHAWDPSSHSPVPRDILH